MNEILIILLLLIKHFICDYPLQRPYQLMNKGIYGHPGGLLHAAIHGTGTLIVLLFFAPVTMALGLAMLDALIHYHVDWTKNRINTHFGFSTSSGSGFWILFGLDQLVHQMTYILLIIILIY